MKNLSVPVQYLRGVGPARARMFNFAGIETAEDLLSWIPVRYEDRTKFLPIASLSEGDRCVVKGKISASGKRPVRKRGFSLFEVIVSDGRGAISIKFFNQPYMSNILKEGRTAVFFGRVSLDKYNGFLTMLNPEIEIMGSGEDELIHSDRIVPVYRRIDKISGRMIRKTVFMFLSESPEMREMIPNEILKKYGFPEISEALKEIHFPSVPPGVDPEAFVRILHERETVAQKRMAYGEFFVFQAGMKQARIDNARVSSSKDIKITPRLKERVIKILPFKPTQAQKKALGEIVRDIVAPRRMNRLLQGDVGSGKTIVALQAMIVLVENGYQAAIMAPTELLAEQHFIGISRLLSNSPYRVGFLSSSVKGNSRNKFFENLASGEIQLVVGTHSLIQKGVEFKNLGLAVIDEQHRFGVSQRVMLGEKGFEPDILVMTATPIPRSLAMTLYGDLDVSIIDQMPPGRIPVKTVVKSESGREEVFSLVREKLKAGEQVYVVCPLVEESEQSDLTAATETCSRLQDIFPAAGVGLLHGRMSPEEKTLVMEDFRKGNLQVLVTTTVVEVGIDVPSATVMIIEHAERFGLSQMHQLRGRVGRGLRPGLCVLMVAGKGTREAAARLRVMSESNNGFVIAEKDLEIRGPGDYLGARQSGAADFHFGNLVKHFSLLADARQDVSDLFDQGGISRNAKKLLLESFSKKWGDKAGFYSSG